MEGLYGPTEIPPMDNLNILRQSLEFKKTSVYREEIIQVLIIKIIVWNILY